LSKKTLEWLIYTAITKGQIQTAVNLVGSLLRQLIQARSTIPDDIIALYRHHIDKQTRPMLTEYSKLLQPEVRRLSKVFIVVGALDECSESNGIRGLLPEVKKLLPDIHLLVTSRYIGNIEREFDSVNRLEIRASNADVKNYLNAQIEGHPQLARHMKADPTLRNTILDTVIQKTSGMYCLIAKIRLQNRA
jgi:hypothetical protein